MHLNVLLERFSKPNIQLGLERTGPKIVLKIRLTRNRKLCSANRNAIDRPYGCTWPLTAAALAVARRSRSVSQRSVPCQTVQLGGLPLPSPRTLVIAGQHLLPMPAYGHVQVDLRVLEYLSPCTGRSTCRSIYRHVQVDLRAGVFIAMYR